MGMILGIYRTALGLAVRSVTAWLLVGAGEWGRKGFI